MFEAHLDQEEVALFRRRRLMAFDVKGHVMDHQDLCSEVWDQEDHPETTAVERDQAGQENRQVDPAGANDFPHSQHPLLL